MSPGLDGGLTPARLAPWVSGLLMLGVFAVLTSLELRRPLRRAVEPKARRVARNLAVAALGAAAVQLAELPVVLSVAGLVARRGWGIVQWAPLPGWLAPALGTVLMDYTLYLWHVLVHRVPFLWRFHVVHHIDLDLDASTALRFHFAELLISIPWRVGQVLLIGVSPLALSVWQTALLVSTLFHHSNVRLPIGLERWLVRLVVTPRMHGIHHSTVRDETDANWSSGLTLWDWLHGTLRLYVPQAAVTIGVPAWRDPAEVTLPRVLALPFGPERPAWAGPSPTREARRTAPGWLLA